MSDPPAFGLDCPDRRLCDIAYTIDGHENPAWIAFPPDKWIPKRAPRMKARGARQGAQHLSPAGCDADCVPLVCNTCHYKAMLHWIARVSLPPLFTYRERPLRVGLQQLLAGLALVAGLGQPLLVEDAAAQTVRGDRGADGADGTFGRDGQDGEDGQGVFRSVRTASTFGNSSAAVVGGAGGNGGDGSDLGGDGGDGGQGGLAEADVRVNVTRNTSSTQVSASAEAGAGGDPGRAGNPDGSPGVAADGASARAIAEGTATAVTRSFLSSARAEGGDGGDAYGTGRRGGNGGAVEVSSFSTANPETDQNSAYTTGEGGRGGMGRDGADAGDGADVHLVDAAGGTGGEWLFLQQNALAGDGGSLGEVGGLTGISGRAGNASSRLEASNPDGRLSIRVLSKGGDAGFVGGGASGDASASAIGSASNDVDIDAIATAGSGSIVGTDSPGMDGGQASFGLLRGESTGGGEVSVEAWLTTGSGSASRTRAGNGVDAIATNAVDGETTGALTLRQIVEAGSGGTVARGEEDAIGGRGGRAISELVVEKSAASILVDVEATAGKSFGRSAAGDLLEAPEARAIADVTNAAGTVSIEYEAIGGEGTSSFTAGDTNGVGGDGTAIVHATTRGDGQAISVGVTGTPGSRGGRGGTNVPFSDAELGGDGGAARTEATGTAEGDSTVDVRALATGGRGGTLNGDGGDATAIARGSNAGFSSVDVLASATGGIGGGNQSSASDMRGGDGGSGIASAHGESSGGGDVSVTARVTGARGTEGGRGGHAVVEDAVSGSTTGALRLTQQAFGGSYVSGLGGDATTTLEYTDDTASRLVLEAVAQAGGGATTGSAHAAASGVGAGHVDVRARVLTSFGDRGGDITLGQVRGESTGGGDVVVTAEIGADDYRGVFGGALDGGDVQIDNAVDGRTTGRLELVQRAIAGNPFTR